MEVISKIERKVRRIASGKDKIKPGQPIRFPLAASLDDCIRQGDLYLVLVDNVPPDYLPSSAVQLQLVPGNTVGAKHCLDSSIGVEQWLPPNWNEDSLDGPVMRFTEERTVVHPTHGHVIIPAGMMVQCHYQREWSREEAKERRARD